ncbi:MAG TPA: UDP-N-acetylglucosamine 2-epimerase (non-hydrolyzing) [Cyanobacteria bacterium UBA8803]|nr:UDP-N-acetylglucosamine 2-epimerase (non-hydrolyzing) [Cyanobacteria bacterium UBA9273]HBL61191.1 UDP-N-acetylglucosamine 2-epimerase (non-hydrolyzing) [Cyanobacteria bacterium UBA8803]
MKVLTVIGTRPQFIKASAVSRVLRERGHKELLVHTGQHYDPEMSQIFFDELGIPEPDINLGVGSGTHAEQTAGMLISLEGTIQEYQPDWVVVYGDTNSTLAGVLVAAKLYVPVAHVEAGLRSFNRQMPEEINRIVTDAISNLLFAPTETASINLHKEGVPAERVYIVGDVMYDAALQYAAKADRHSQILDNLGLRSREYILATIHRAENTDDSRRLSSLVEALYQVASAWPIVWPIHPRTRAALNRDGLLEQAERAICLIDPVGYLDMVQLEKSAVLVATDSGGVQKEAFFYRVPCVTLRDETEWIELVELCWNRLCPPTSVENLVEGIRSAVGTIGCEGNPYGKGDAAQRIVQILTRHS